MLAEATARGYHSSLGAAQTTPVMDPLQDGGAKLLLHHHDLCFFIPVCPETGTVTSAAAQTPTGWPAAIKSMPALPPIDALQDPATTPGIYPWLDLTRMHASLAVCRPIERLRLSDTIVDMHWGIGCQQQLPAETPPQGHCTEQLHYMLRAIAHR